LEGIEEHDSSYNFKTGIAEQLSPVSDFVKKSGALSQEVLDSISGKVNALQKKIGYDGNYERWVNSHLPKRLEEMVNS
jgi:hypothetical protein